MTKDEVLAALKRQVRLLEMAARIEEQDKLLSTDMRVDARYLSAAIANIERTNSWITMTKGEAA